MVNHLGRDARALVGDLDHLRSDADGDRGRSAGFLGSIDRVVAQLLNHDQGSEIGSMADLHLQLAPIGEVERSCEVRKVSSATQYPIG